MIGISTANQVLGTAVQASLVEGDTLYGTRADWLNQVRAHWLDIVRADALQQLTRAGTAAFRTIREELAEAQEAGELGVPPPDGRSAAEVQALLDQGRQEFRQVYQAVEAAASVAEINAALQQARDSGLTWLVGLDWEPYPETCPWMVGT